MPTHAMIDLETLGVGTMPALLTIGACVFDPRAAQPLDRPVFDPNGTTAGSALHLYVNPESCLWRGATISYSTLRWWQGRGVEAREAAWVEPNLQWEVWDALSALGGWLKSHQVERVWSHGASFDAAVLERYYERVKREVPWAYNAVRDTRTIFELLELSEDPTDEAPIKHHAGWDAWSQARRVWRCYDKLRNLKGI